MQPNKITLALSWIAIVAVFALWWSMNDRQSRVVVRTADGQAMIRADAQGHFVAEGTINGRAVVFLLDTGATYIALPRSLANTLRLTTHGEVMINTANGRTLGALTRLDEVSLGEITLHNLTAVVQENMDEDAVLLGLNFLKQLTWLQRDGALYLRPPSNNSETPSGL